MNSCVCRNISAAEIDIFINKKIIAFDSSNLVNYVILSAYPTFQLNLRKSDLKYGFRDFFI